MNMAKRFGKVSNYAEWIKPKLVSNALELLDKEIPKYRHQIKSVHLCFMTDPFMYKYKEVSDMSIKILEKLNKNNIKCTILTKGVYPNIRMNKQTKLNEYGITIVSLNNEFKNRYEPYTAPFLKRINSLKQLHDKGLKTWVSMEPYPTPLLDKKHNLKKLLNKIKFVDTIVFGKLNYNIENSRYENHDEFYENCSKQVIDFCEKHKINYHIKFGTRKEFDERTIGVFKGNRLLAETVALP